MDPFLAIMIPDHISLRFHSTFSHNSKHHLKFDHPNPFIKLGTICHIHP